MNTEDSEFERIEREAKMRLKHDDDDIQVYKKPWVGLTEDDRDMILRSDGSIFDMTEAILKAKNT